MRAQFTQAILKIAETDSRIVFLSGDLGFMALEEVRDALGDRFINAGIAEQNMVSVAAGLAALGFIPLIYSIAPFAVLRPYEQIRNDICLHNLPVKIIGNGGGYGYGIMGATHHALEDVAVMRTLPNMSVYVPSFGSDVTKVVDEMLSQNGPCYLRLGKSVPDFGEVSEHSNWKPFRKVASGDSIVVAAMGPVIENVLTWLPDLPQNSLDLWAVGKFPIYEIPKEFMDSVKRAKAIITLEEHYRSGGLAENLSIFLMNLSPQKVSVINLFAQGYPSGRYGSQKWHQDENGLGGAKLLRTIQSALNL
jgi:transketolase